jgi:hypothetical protein
MKMLENVNESILKLTKFCNICFEYEDTKNHQL